MKTGLKCNHTFKIAKKKRQSKLTTSLRVGNGVKFEPFY